MQFLQNSFLFYLQATKKPLMLTSAIFFLHRATPLAWSLEWKRLISLKTLYHAFFRVTDYEFHVIFFQIQNAESNIVDEFITI